MSTTPLKSSYSILVMRDDHTVSTFRMRAFWLKVIIIAMILLVLSCAAAIYGTYYYHGRYQAAAEKRNALQAELTVAKVELQERRNLAILPMDGDRESGQGYSVASMVKSYRPSSTGDSAAAQPANTGEGQTSAQASVQTSGQASGQTSGQPTDATTSQTSGQQSPQASGAASTQASGTAAAGGEAPQAGNSTQAANTNAAASSSATPSQSDLNAIMGQDGPVTVAGLDQPASATQDMDNHPIKVSNLASTVEAGSKLRLNFDIANLPQKGALAGNCRIFAVTRQGAEIELAPVSRGSLTFRIERYRRMQTTMVIPANLKAEDILNIKIAVTLKDNPAEYWKTFPAN